MTARVAVAVIACAGAVLGAAQRQVFRSGIQIVSVDVSVKTRNTPVAGLTSADFALRDNGVTQTIDAVTSESLPLDVTLVLDVSASVGPMLVKLENAVRDTSALLAERDQLRLIAISHELHQVFGFTPGGTTPAFAGLSAGGATSLYDGIVAAMLKTRPPERRHLIVAFTDGADTRSFFDAHAARDVALRADAVLELVVGLHPTERALTPVPNKTLLDELAGATGGGVLGVDLSLSIGGAFKQIIDDFRKSYVLRYAAEGVTREGWHDIVVKVTKPGKYDVRARKGYSGG
jgi:VWFA-related protein